MDDTAQEVRLAAIDGLRQLGDTSLAQHMEARLEDPDMQVGPERYR